MFHYLAFLRGINLGKRRIEMARLRTLFVELKFADVATFIASGNVIFASRRANTSGWMSPWTACKWCGDWAVFP